jgi:hypothetical protein
MTAHNDTRISPAVRSEQDTLAGGLFLGGSAHGDLAASTHALAGRGTLRITPTRRPSGLAITGGIDEYTYGILVGQLQRFTAGPDEIHVNLTAVEYCDLVGLRAIIGLTRADDHGHDHNGRRVVLHGAPLYLTTVMRILGWDSTPGLIVDDGPGSSPPRSDGVSGGAMQARERRTPVSAEVP